MANLFTEGKIGPIKIKNRIVMPPMCMFNTDDNALPKDFHYVHYVQRAIHGVGLIIIEATGVTGAGRITNTDLGIWSDDCIAPLKRIVDSCHEYGAKILIQLGHAGRKCEVDYETPLAPSSIAFDDLRVPDMMSIKDIDECVNQFKQGAQRAIAAGFDGVEIHGAHGYLVNQFLSPLTNKRTDDYGGSIENRSRLLKRIALAIRSILPKNKALTVRISAEEYHEAGQNAHDLAAILNGLDGLFDGVDVSTGGVINAKIDTYPGYQIRPAEIIKTETKLPVISGGMIFEPRMANEIIANKRADFVFIGRALLRNSEWALNAQEAFGQIADWPDNYRYAVEKLKVD